MKKFWKKAAVLAEAALLLLLFTGCWNYHELETYSIVAGIAVDKGENGYRYHVTFECLKMAGGTKNAQIQPLLVEEDGNTIFDAVRSTLRESDKKLYFHHCRVVILSSDIAKEGLRSVTDWIKRDAEPRLTMDVVISKEKTAAEILRVKPKSGQLTAYQISNTLAESGGYYGTSSGVRIFEMTNTLNSEGISLVLPTIEKKATDSGETLQLTGGAVFKGDRLVGWLDAEPAKYYALIRGKVRGGLLLTGITPGSTQLCLEIQRCETKVKPVVSGDTVMVDIRVHMRTAFAEQDSETDLFSKIGIGGVERDADRTVQYETTRVVKDVQQAFGTDIFGFGNLIYQNQPKEWKRLRPRWDQIFRKLKVHVTADVEIGNTALNNEKGEGLE